MTTVPAKTSPSVQQIAKPTEPWSSYHAANIPSRYGTVLLLGEAPGEDEEREGVPFIGSSGEILNGILRDAGFQRRKLYARGSPFHDDRGAFTLLSELSATNVFTTRPPGNEIKSYTVTKTELRREGFSEAGRLPQLNKRYLHPKHEPELQRLVSEIEQLAPRLIIALGGTALWALTGDGRITQYRGTFFVCKVGSHTCDAIATFHPASVIRQWDQRPIAWADLVKARRHLEGTLPAPLTRKLYINPTEQELSHVYQSFASQRHALLGVDIETSPACGQITTFAIGSATTAICIPVWNPSTLPALSECYGSASEEAHRWGWIRRFCELANPKVLQNGLYDMQYLLEELDLRIENVLHDTAILQHSTQPELKKDLGTLASLYLNEPAWKFMRESVKDEKVDE